jgi:hypothetical protein
MFFTALFILLIKKYINYDTNYLLDDIWVKNIKVNKKRKE